MRARPEAFGAIVRLDDPPALVSLNRARARGLGIDGGALWDGPDPGLEGRKLTAPTEAHVAATARCGAGCKACYADATPDGHMPEARALFERLDALAEMGVFHVAFGGGEALSHPELPAVVAHARARGLVPTLTTSGLGLTPKKARALADAGLAQANVSFDGVGGAYEDVRGYDGREKAERAMRLLREAGVDFGVNMVMTRQSLSSLETTAAHVAGLGATELQLLRLKPSGRGKLDYLAMRLSPAQIDGLGATLASLAGRFAPMHLRVDCAVVPYLSATDVSMESMQRLGVLGCEAGRSLMTITPEGDTAPCSFWSSDAHAPRFDGRRTWDEAAILERFRDYVASPPEPCARCALRPVCRGGCRIVAGFLNDDPFTPDPECPRVRAHAALGSG